MSFTKRLFEKEQENQSMFWEKDGLHYAYLDGKVYVLVADVIKSVSKIDEVLQS